jgi:hypothetical protein
VRIEVERGRKQLKGKLIILIHRLSELGEHFLEFLCQPALGENTEQKIPFIEQKELI